MTIETWRNSTFWIRITHGYQNGAYTINVGYEKIYNQLDISRHTISIAHKIIKYTLQPIIENKETNNTNLAGMTSLFSIYYNRDIESDSGIEYLCLRPDGLLLQIRRDKFVPSLDYLAKAIEWFSLKFKLCYDLLTCNKKGIELLEIYVCLPLDLIIENSIIESIFKLDEYNHSEFEIERCVGCYSHRLLLRQPDPENIVSSLDKMLTTLKPFLEYSKNMSR